MPPRSTNSTTVSSVNDENTEKHHNDDDISCSPTCSCVQQHDGNFTVCCAAHPYPVRTIPAEHVNQQLNLNLGQKLINPENKLLRSTIAVLNFLLLQWWETLLFQLIQMIPLNIRQRIVFTLWKLYYPVHRYLLRNTTGIHASLSYEYHALTTILWWGRLFPVSIQRMRFLLSQLSVYREDGPDMKQVERIEYDMKLLLREEMMTIQHTTVVRGAYIHQKKEDSSSSCQVIFWLYGGAFLSGCVDGNLGPASHVGRVCQCDVFLPSYRLIPEASSLDDMLWDVVLSYKWLVEVRGIHPSNIILLGVSSGAGLVTRLLQLIRDASMNEETTTKTKTEITSLLLQSSPPHKKYPSLTPLGAVLMCPFVDYTTPKGTLEHYPKHDLVVNQSVCEVGFPYFEQVLGDEENRKCASPVYNSFQQLPPLCVVVSEHEAVYDQTIELVNRARQQHIQVSLGVWKYLSHVFCFLSAFIPEGQESMEFVCDWIQQQYTKKEKKE